MLRVAMKSLIPLLNHLQHINLLCQRGLAVNVNSARSLHHGFSISDQPKFPERSLSWEPLSVHCLTDRFGLKQAGRET